jgi:hypothetical protein
MNTTEDDQPIGEAPDVTGIAVVDAAAAAARHTRALQAAVDEIRALVDGTGSLLAALVRDILERHGV